MSKSIFIPTRDKEGKMLPIYNYHDMDLIYLTGSWNITECGDFIYGYISGNNYDVYLNHIPHVGKIGLKMACANGHSEPVKTICEEMKKYIENRETNANIRKYYKESLNDGLQLACRNGNKEIVEYLLNLGFDLKTNNNGAYYEAIEQGHREISEIIKEKFDMD